MPLNAEINVVSLIDVILLLLIIFMITAPMMTGGIDLTLPEANVTPMESRNAVVVSLDRNGVLRVDSKVWTLENFRAGFKAYLDGKGQTSVTFLGDTTVVYGKIIAVTEVLAAAGISTIGLAVDPKVGRVP